jgi:hypothetical protein
MDKYFINKFSMATAMNYLGYHYTKETDCNGKTTYVFERTPELMEAVHKLVELKQAYGKIY